MVLRPGLRFVEPVLDLSYSNHAGQQGYPTRPRIRRGPAQRQRGGWGEVCDCYECHRGRERREAAVAERIAATEAMAREREVARIHAARQAQATRREVARREVARREALAREKYRAARAASQIQAQRAEQDRRAAGRRIDLSGSGPGLRRRRPRGLRGPRALLRRRLLGGLEAAVREDLQRRLRGGAAAGPSGPARRTPSTRSAGG